MAGILDILSELQKMGPTEPVRAPLQMAVQPNLTGVGGGGILGNMTPLTMRWRNMMRGQNTMAGEGEDAARAQARGESLDPYQQQLMRMPWVQGILGGLLKYNTPEAWQRRALASKPEAQFDNQGNLSNFDQLKTLYGQ